MNKEFRWDRTTVWENRGKRSPNKGYLKVRIHVSHTLKSLGKLVCAMQCLIGICVMLFIVDALCNYNNNNNN